MVAAPLTAIGVTGGAQAPGPRCRLHNCKVFTNKITKNPYT